MVEKGIRMANRINQNNCFASHKDEDWCTQSEMSERVASCYVLKEEHFGKMKRLGFCGTKACPFFKQSRKEVRLD